MDHTVTVERGGNFRPLIQCHDLCPIPGRSAFMSHIAWVSNLRIFFTTKSMLMIGLKYKAQ